MSNDAGAVPLRFGGHAYQAVMVAPNYPGGPGFDDHLDLSRAAFAAGLSTWANWRRGPGGNIDELAGNATAADFLNAMTPYQAGGAQALQAGDLFFGFYFGHGATGPFSPGNVGEQAPALSVWDESMIFGNPSSITDDQFTAAMGAFNPGVFKFIIDISCFSGGFWNGNDVNGAGDLEQVPRTILIVSSSELQSTYTSGIGPRPWEPLLLVRMINTLFFAPHNRNLSIAEFYARSAVAGAAINANRFDESTLPPGDALWSEIVSGDFDSSMLANFSLDELPGIGAPEPGSEALVALGLGMLALGRLQRRKN
ncbi:MAG: hypothetical protein KF778_01435 [Rhodocyclaceae bacterium]|nr:hypothetical protein [Rhodocyclaceae bacterium]